MSFGICVYLGGCSQNFNVYKWRGVCYSGYMKLKLNRTVYRFWHNRSARGRVGYVGKDSYYPLRANLVKRSKDKACKMLYRALRKHPLKFWCVEILASGFRKDETLNKAEIFYIKKFDSKNKGYNCTDGGEGQRGWIPSKAWRLERSRILTGRKLSLEHIAKVVKSLTGRKHSIETKAKISAAHIGMSLSAKTIKKLSELGKNLVGDKNPFYGRKHSAKTKAHWSRVRKGRKLSAKHKDKISKGGKLGWIKRRVKQAKLNGGQERTNSGGGSRAAR